MHDGAKPAKSPPSAPLPSIRPRRASILPNRGDAPSKVHISARVPRGLRDSCDPTLAYGSKYACNDFENSQETDSQPKLTGPAFCVCLIKAFQFLQNVIAKVGRDAPINCQNKSLLVRGYFGDPWAIIGSPIT